MSRSTSNCLCVGTILSWCVCRWAIMDRLGCDSIDCVLQGESSHTGRMKTTRRRLGDAIEQAITCRLAFRMSSCSYSGLAMHDPESL